MAIKLIVDSASDIDEAEAKEKSVTLIPMEITFGDETFYDGVNLSHRQFFEKLIETDLFPKTSQINEFRFNQAFEGLIKGDDEVLCITMSSKLSGTYQSAVAAAKKYGGRVRVVDSFNVCVGERILIEYAMRLIDKGLPLAQICELLDSKKKNIQLLALLDTLKYLQKGGRISTLKAFAGELLHIKPVIAIKGGEVKLVGKAVGSKKGNNLLVQMIDAEGGIDFTMPYAAAYSGLTDVLLQKYLRDSAHLYEEHTDYMPCYMIGSTIGTHAGPGAIAVAFFSN